MPPAAKPISATSKTNFNSRTLATSGHRGARDRIARLRVRWSGTLWENSKMRNRVLLTVVVASAAISAALTLTMTHVTGQAARPARTPDGKPNLNGLWQATTTANWDLQAHAARPMVGQAGVYPDVPGLAAPVPALGAAGGGPPGPGVVVGGASPYKPEALARKKDNAEH